MAAAAAAEAAARIETARSAPGTRSEGGGAVARRLYPSRSRRTWPATHLIKILKGVTKSQKDIDLNINDNLIGWSLSRIDSVSRAILRSALYELRECIDIPVKVIINEYIEISKSFFEGDESNFINGILDKVSKIYRPNEF